MVGNDVYLNADTCIETGPGGSVRIGDGSHIHARCHISSHLEGVSIGSGVQIAPNSALYSFDHGTRANVPIREQPLRTKGPVTIGDNAWLGFGSIVLTGVTVGKGAVVGAGSVVTSDVPDGTIAVGNPARVVRRRT